MKHNFLFFLLLSFYGCCTLSMELPLQISWYILPETVIMPIVAMLEISDKQTLCLVNKQLAHLASKKNIDNLLQWPCVLSRDYHLNLMVEYAINNNDHKNDHKMILAIKSAPLCDHHHAIEIISYFITPDDSSTLNYLSLYKNDHHDDYLLKLLPTIIAVYRGNQNICENYKEFIVEPEKRSTLSVLQLAAHCNHLAPAELFLIQEEQGIADFHTNKKDMSDWSPLHIAVENNHINMIKLLCKYSKTNINAQLNSDGITPLFMAANEGHLECARYLLSKKANINTPSTNNHTPLFIAANRGHVDMVELLITENAIIDVPGKDNITPLFTAILLPKENDNCHKQIRITKMLLEAGADPNIQNQKMLLTPLILATDLHNHTIAKLLLKHKALVNMQTKLGQTALIVATEKSYYEIMQLLLKYKADPNICNNKKRTALHEAAENRNLEAGELLFKNGALLDVQDNNGDSPLIVSVNKNNIVIIARKVLQENNWEKADSPLNSFKMTQSLLDMGANPNIADNNGNTALMKALFFENIAMVDLLLQHEANPYIKNLKGDNAYSLAYNDEIKELLQKAKETKKAKDKENCIIS